MKFDRKILFLLGYVILSGILVFWLKPVYLVSILIVLLPPTIVNFFWLKKSKKKVFLFSIISALLMAPAVELCARLANVWDVASIMWRPFGLIPIENMIFAFLNFLWVLSFYEYFIDRDHNKKISLKFRILIFIYSLAALIIYILFFAKKELITLNYFTIALPLLIIPSIIIFYNKPSLLRKIILPTIFFALVFFFYETISLIIGSWWWPGEYIFDTNIFGKNFPLDDVVIWYFLSTPTLIGGYEFFADNWK